MCVCVCVCVYVCMCLCEYFLLLLIQIAHGQRHLIDYYSVKSRAFIGNTSMDAQLSLIMANQAKVSVLIALHSCTCFLTILQSILKLTYYT